MRANLPNNAIHCGLLALILVFLSGCSIAPITPQVNARTLPKGKIGIAAWASPFAAVQGSYGITDKLEIGGGFEQVSDVNLWLKYSLFKNESFALAGTAGIFKGSEFNNASGQFAGLVLSQKIHNRFDFFTSYRFTHSNYTPVDHSDIYLSDDELYSSIDSRDSEDLSRTSLLNLGLTFNASPLIRLHIGAGCQYHHRNNDPKIDTHPCIPLLGLSVGKQ